MVNTRPDGPAATSLTPTSSLVQNRETTERAVIVRALERVSGSRTRAAQLLGVSRVTLYKKMRKYQLLPAPVPAETVDLAAADPVGG